MARTPEQRGPFGRWLVAERKARGWTADDMRARLQEARGFAMAHSTYALLESGQRQPTEEQRRHLTAFLGSEPQTDAPATTQPADIAALIAALTRQTEATAALMEDLRAEREELRAERAARLELQQTVNDLARDLERMAEARRADAEAADRYGAPMRIGPDAPPPDEDEPSIPARDPEPDR